MESILNFNSQIDTLWFFLIAMMVIFIILIYLIPLSLWFTAHALGVKVSIGQILVMRLRSIPVKEVLEALIIAKKAGIELSLAEAQIHWLAGGDLLNVVNGLAEAKKAGVEIPFDKASKANIKGVDIEKAVKNKTLDNIN